MNARFTIDELATVISEGLPEAQAAFNKDWLRNMHAMLKNGGVWGWPEGDRVFQKNGEGFIEVTPEGGV